MIISASPSASLAPDDQIFFNNCRPVFMRLIRLAWFNLAYIILINHLIVDETCFNLREFVRLGQLTYQLTSIYIFHLKWTTASRWSTLSTSLSIDVCCAIARYLLFHAIQPLSRQARSQATSLCVWTPECKSKSQLLKSNPFSRLP